jgi:CRP-like cAMP-binding protein
MLTWQDEELSGRERLVALKALYGLRGQIALHLADLALPDPDRLVRATHAELALDLGCSRPHLSEHLNEFRARGLIQYRRHDGHRQAIAVADLDGLLREAEK